MFNVTVRKTYDNFTCTSTRLSIIQSKYCNGIKDCEDGSDEPASCGKTYWVKSTLSVGVVNLCNYSGLLVSNSAILVNVFPTRRAINQRQKWVPN